MRDGYTIIQTYVNSIDAEIAKSQLVALGLEAMVQADNCGGMRPHFDLTGGVYLLVPDADAERAKALLEGFAASPVTRAWICRDCGEGIDAGFDTCWKCGAAAPTDLD